MSSIPYSSPDFPLPSFPRCSLITLLVVFIALPVLLLTSGCRKKDWIPEEKKAIYKAQVAVVDEGIYIHKKNEESWNNLILILNKDYVKSVTHIGEGEKKFIFYFEGFKHKETGQPFDPNLEEVWRIWIEGDEGYWY